MISDGAGRVFEYWHVVPAVTSGRVIAYVTVIGHVEAPWGHVHFSERLGSRYLNPLRPGAMSPYFDLTTPRIVRLGFERAGRRLGPVLGGRVDIVIETYDPPASAVPAPWDRTRVMPAVIRWRLVGSAGNKHGWSLAFNASRLLPESPYSSVFTGGTRQNRTYRVGRYRIYLARQFDTAALVDGSHTLEVSVADTRQNVSTNATQFATANT